MKAALISLGSTSSQWTLEAMKKYFDDVENIDLREIEINLGAKKNPVLYRGKPLPKFDCVFAKGSFRYSPVLRSIVSLLPKDTYTPIKYSSFTLGHDKLLTHQILQVAGIPMPLTYIATTSEAAKKILQNMKYPVVMKFPQGTQGKGVMIAESFASANSLLDALNVLNQPFIIQEYIETDGSDIRAFVVGDKVVAAMKRKAVQGEKRANIHAGGIGEPLELDNYTKKVAIETAKVMGAEICGVDILESASGPKVIEINLSPSLQGISTTTKVDVADKIGKFLFEKTKKMLNTDEGDAKKMLQNEGISDMNSSKEIITTLDMRGERILLPEVVTKLTKFGDKKEMIIRASKKELNIKEFKI
jgi:ribosomal protein S6--L-glutamate ligase